MTEAPSQPAPRIRAPQIRGPLTRQTWRAQDAVCLGCAPLLVATAIVARRGGIRSHRVMVGTLTWLAYCYAHLSFAVPFNSAFLIYVAILGLCGFGMLDGLLRVDVHALHPSFAGVPVRAAAWFLLVASVGVAGLWLSDIVPGLFGVPPANLFLAGLPNPTWVLDLVWILPVCVAGAMMLLRDRAAGPVVAGVMLVMLALLSVCMLLVTPFALAAGLWDDPVARPQLVAFTVVFAVLGGVQLALLVVGGRRTTTPSVGWLRPGWWPEGVRSEDARSGTG